MSNFRRGKALGVDGWAPPTNLLVELSNIIKQVPVGTMRPVGGGRGGGGRGGGGGLVVLLVPMRLGDVLYIDVQ